LRFLYAKELTTLGSSIRIAGYRYSTNGYRTFQEAVLTQNPLADRYFHSRRSEMSLQLGQRIGKSSSLFSVLRQQRYWGTDTPNRLIQVGYNNAYRGINYNFSYSHSSNLYESTNRQFTVGVSLPLGKNRASARHEMNNGNKGGLAQRSSINGSVFDDARLTYTLSAHHIQSQGVSWSGSSSYLSPTGRFDVSRAQGRGYAQTTLGVAGGLVAHGGGVTLSQTLGETMALAVAPDAVNVGFDSYPGVRTDRAGHAVLANLSPYRINRLAIRTSDLGDEVEVRNAAMNMVPTRGAVVMARFETAIGLRLMLVLTDHIGKPLPFGSKVENQQGQDIGIVGPDGQTYVTGAEESGVLSVKWGQGEQERCTVAYQVRQEENPPPVRVLDGQCN
jgi:outer membrane usher protein